MFLMFWGGKEEETLERRNKRIKIY